MIISNFTGQEMVELETRAMTRGVQYRDHDLPPGCLPPRGRIGVVTEGPQVLLHVDRSVRYRGADPEVRQWVETGTRRFRTLDELLGWVSRKVERGGRARSVVDLDKVEDVELLDRSLVDARDLELLLREHIVGQQQALHVIASSVSRHVSKARHRRPLALMLVGPTGVGKTATGEQMAEALTDLTGKPWHLIRLDMAEYVDKFSVTRLFGAPPGYIGHGDRGTLAKMLEANPRCVVIFDEIEKAHPDVLTSLMNLMDAGRIASSEGSERVAANAILMFTSNLPVVTTKGLAEKSQVEIDNAARGALVRAGMRREVVGRITHICAFSDLSSRERAEVVAHAIAKVAEDYDLEIVKVDPGFISRILRDSHDSGVGVRGVEHLVDAVLGPRLAVIDPRTLVRIQDEDGEVEVDEEELEPAAAS